VDLSHQPVSLYLKGDCQCLKQTLFQANFLNFFKTNQEILNINQEAQPAVQTLLKITGVVAPRVFCG
jgi:hypothetical protein